VVKLKMTKKKMSRRHEDTQRIHNQYNSLCEFSESLGLSG